jgi:uncharacterized protein with PQ loop repeat
MKLIASILLSILFLPCLQRTIQNPDTPAVTDSQIVWEFDTGG